MSRDEIRDSHAIAEAIELHKKQRKEEDDAAPPIVKVLKPFALVELPEDILLKVLSNAGPRSVLVQVCKRFTECVKNDPYAIPDQKPYAKEVLNGLYHVLDLTRGEDVLEALNAHMYYMTAEGNELGLQQWESLGYQRGRVDKFKTVMTKMGFNEKLLRHLMHLEDFAAIDFVIGFHPFQSYEPRLQKVSALYSFLVSDPWDRVTMPSYLQELSYESLNENAIRHFGFTTNIMDVVGNGGRWHTIAANGMSIFYGAKRFDLARLLHRNAWISDGRPNESGYPIVFPYDEARRHGLKELIYYVTRLPKQPHYAETEHFLEHDVRYMWTRDDLFMLCQNDNRSLDDPLLESVVRSTKPRLIAMGDLEREVAFLRRRVEASYSEDEFLRLEEIVSRGDPATFPNGFLETHALNAETYRRSKLYQRLINLFEAQ